MSGTRFFCVILGAALFAAVIFLKLPASAAGPEVYITWKTTDGSAPVDYQGKILPKTGSQMVVSVEAITGGGKFADLGGQTIYWYLDDNFVAGGVGKQTVSFIAPSRTEIMSVRVIVPNYPGGQLVNTAHIRMVDPRMALIAPYPNGIFSGASVEVHAVPYFFNAANLAKLSYSWTVNGQSVAAAENPRDLIINLAGDAPAGYSLGVGLTVRQSDDPFLNARSNITLSKAAQ